MHALCRGRYISLNMHVCLVHMQIDFTIHASTFCAHACMFCAQAMVFVFLGLLVFSTQPEPAKGEEHYIVTIKVRHAHACMFCAQAMVFAFLGLLVLCTQPEPAEGEEHSIATTKVRQKAGFKRIRRDTHGRHVETTSVTFSTDRTDRGNPKPSSSGFQEIFLSKRRGNASRSEEKVSMPTANHVFK